MAYLKAPIIDKNNSRISAESCHGDVKAISVLYCTIPSVFTRRCLAAVEVKNMTMKTMNIFLNILLTSDADIKYSHSIFLYYKRMFWKQKCWKQMFEVKICKAKYPIVSKIVFSMFSYFSIVFCFTMLWFEIICFVLTFIILFLIFNDMSGL